MSYIITHTRFSVYSPSSQAWKSSRTLSDENYKSYLFDPKRLQQRLNFFEKISLPNLEKNYCSNSDFRNIVTISDELPKGIYERLKELEEKNVFLKIVNQSHFNRSIESILEKKGENFEGVFAFSRLDDDDALAPGYSEHLKKYLREDFSDFLVTMPSGYTGIMSDDGITYSNLRKVFLPMINIGLSRIIPFKIKNGRAKFKIPKIGAHMTANQRFKTVVDPTEVAFLWSRNLKQDTSVDKLSDEKILKYLSKLEHADHAEVMQHFDCLL